MNATLAAPDYGDFLKEVKQRVQIARLQAGRAVNRELVLLYWDLGRSIVEKQRNAGWGDAVVERLASDLRAAFPGVTGFSLANVWRMRQFFESYSNPEILAQAARDSQTRKEPPEFHAQVVREWVGSVPWGHHVHLLGKIKEPAALLYYLRATAQHGWSRSILVHQVQAGAYERAVRDKKTHNFDTALSGHLSRQADEMLKSRYNLEFLGLAPAMKERDLEQRLIQQVQRFLLELGYGFCFIGRQYRLTLGANEYFVDLLFYHRFLKALVAFDLKVGRFEPEHAGKMDFYLNVLNEKERGPEDHPSIGIILCAQKDDIEVEFALKSKANPIGVAQYQMQGILPEEFRGKLPSAKQLAEVIREALPNGKGPSRLKKR